MKKLLIIGKVWPEPNSSAAGTRMMQLIALFLANNLDIVFASPAADSEFMADLEKIGVRRRQIEINSESFDRFIEELQPDMVLFDRFTSEEQFGWRIADHCHNALRILDTEDLHCLRAARQLAQKEKREFSLSDLHSEIAFREIASIYRSDVSLIISQFELKILNEHFKIPLDQIHYFPLLAETITEETKKNWPAFLERKHFISIGNFLHEPNWDAVQFLKREIWPLIRKELPDAELHIYGAYATNKVFELHDQKMGFRVKGRAESVGEVMRRARVCIAPLRFGAGLKGKLMDAMAYGTPNVTTEIGAEAMKGDLPWSGEIANNANDFARAAVRLYNIESEWKRAQKNGMSIINTYFSKNKHETDLIELIDFLFNGLKAHRKKNFTGAMFQHHTAQSTKYMSLWIEAKNRMR